LTIVGWRSVCLSLAPANDSMVGLHLV